MSKTSGFPRNNYGQGDDKEGYKGYATSLSLSDGEITDEDYLDSEYDIDLEDRVCLEDEYLDCWKDHVGDLGETDGKIDGETAARPNQILNPWRYGGGVRIRHRRC